MITENLSTLKIHKLSQAQYDRELENGNLDETALYLTPDEEVDLSPYITTEVASSTYETKTAASEKLTEAKVYADTIASGKADSDHNHDNDYDAKGSADTALASANSYTDTKISDLDFMSATNPLGTGSLSLNRMADSDIGENSVAVGCNTVASGTYAFAEGMATTAYGLYSHAGGFSTVADDFQYVIGKYNSSRNPITSVDTVYSTSDSVTTTYPALFIVGNGTDDTSRSNAFTVYANGKCKGLSSFGSSGADYARQYEWLDGNPNNEDRRGLLVVLDGSKIRIATPNDDIEDCEGIVSTCPAFVENDPDEWHDRYLKDIFGRRITQEVIIPEETITKSVEKIDEETGKVVIEEVTEVIPEHTITQFVVNPEYDPEQEYICRDVRPEWTVVGFSGFIVAVDDGTCQVNGYCTIGENGVLTMSETRTAYRVMERKDNNHILVRIK